MYFLEVPPTPTTKSTSSRSKRFYGSALGIVY